MHNDDFEEKTEKELLQDIRTDVWIIKITFFCYIAYQIYLKYNP